MYPDLHYITIKPRRKRQGGLLFYIMPSEVINQLAFLQYSKLLFPESAY